MLVRSLFSATVLALAAPAFAQPAEIDYPRGSLGFEALMKADYAKAERQLRTPQVDVADHDPARLINLGTLLIRTGRVAEGTALLERAMKGEDIELVLADGSVTSAHDAARRALRTAESKAAAR